MASKQSASSRKSALTAATGAAPAKAMAVRTSKPKSVKAAAEIAVAEKQLEIEETPVRVTSARHSKAPAPKEVTAPVEVKEPVAASESPTAAAPEVSAHEAISKIAYGYWEARGFHAGNPHEDWLRAELEHLNRQ